MQAEILEMQSGIPSDDNTIISPPKHTKDAIIIDNLLNTYRNVIKEYEKSHDSRYKYRLLRLQIKMPIQIMRARLGAISKAELDSWDQYYKKISKVLDIHPTS